VISFGNGADKVFYTVYQVDPFAPDMFKRSALIDPNGQKRPAYFALKTLVKKIEFFTQAQKISDGKYRFIVNGQPVYVLWGTGSLPSEISGKVKVTDLYGKETILDAPQIKLTDSPIYVESIK
jgi:hypothetical protein